MLAHDQGSQPPAPDTAGMGADAGSPSSALLPGTTDVPNLPSLLVQKPTVEDTARRDLAYIFTAIFAATVAFACVAVLVSSDTWKNVKELLPIILPAEAALLGSATGFYFGAKK